MRRTRGMTWAVTVLLVLVCLPDASARKTKMGRLIIESMTDGVKVYVDGKMKGKTPFDKPLWLKPGKHKLKATKAGYSTLELPFKIRRGKKTELTVDLFPFSGLVRFTSNVKGAEVYVDNKMLGNTPLIRDVVVGDRKVMILKEGYNDFVTEIKVKAGEKHFVEGVLTPFRDFSPEVMAIKEAEKEKAAQAVKDKQLQEKLANLPEKTVVEAAEPWYQDWYKQWWFWTVAGVVVATAVTVPLVITSTGGEQSGLNDYVPDGIVPLP